MSQLFPETGCYAAYIDGMQCDILDFYIKNIEYLIRRKYQTQ